MLYIYMLYMLHMLYTLYILYMLYTLHMLHRLSIGYLCYICCTCYVRCICYICSICSICCMYSICYARRPPLRVNALVMGPGDPALGEGDHPWGALRRAPRGHSESNLERLDSRPLEGSRPIGPGQRAPPTSRDSTGQPPP